MEENKFNNFLYSLAVNQLFPEVTKLYNVRRAMENVSEEDVDIRAQIFQNKVDENILHNIAYYNRGRMVIYGLIEVYKEAMRREMPGGKYVQYFDNFFALNTVRLINTAYDWIKEHKPADVEKQVGVVGQGVSADVAPDIGAGSSEEMQGATTETDNGAIAKSDSDDNADMEEAMYSDGESADAPEEIDSDAQESVDDVEEEGNADIAAAGAEAIVAFMHDLIVDGENIQVPQPELEEEESLYHQRLLKEYRSCLDTLLSEWRLEELDRHVFESFLFGDFMPQPPALSSDEN